ncbi:KRAB-A domain-containing protein 2-like [Ptychodera flava]|uniref:KRAB-A domain-containing protein 2-like n=1 Tax=Ptychodera flava TaxID=63121 RepID=UPI00396A0577
MLRLLILVLCIYAATGGKRQTQMSAVDDAVYDTLFKLTMGEFDVPVADRTAQQKAACVRFWRNKHKFRIKEIQGEQQLLFNGKAVLMKSDLGKVVATEFRHCKGIGSRKLKFRLLTRYHGVTERDIQKILSSSKLNQRLNARFSNKAITRPIRARAVQVRHQVDLVDMQRSPVSVKGEIFKYILSVQDVLSRYIWLRPLTRKSSEHVSRELYSLYCEVGPPRVLQCDNGGEFKKAVERLCKKMEIKIIRGSPYHPQSQGKVERSHRSLHKKMMYDFMQMSRRGINWAKRLKEYQKLQNEEPMEVLGNRSPFEVFYGRVSNAVTERHPNGLMCRESRTRKDIDIAPRESDIEKSQARTLKIRARTKTVEKQWAERYIHRKMKNNPTSI